MMNQGTAALPTSPEARTNDLVEMIQRGHPAGLEQLYTMAGNFTYFLMRQLGNDEINGSFAFEIDLRLVDKIRR